MKWNFKNVKRYAGALAFVIILALVDCLHENTGQGTVQTVLPFACPLELHDNYTHDEIVTVLGNWKKEDRIEMDKAKAEAFAAML